MIGDGDSKVFNALKEAKPDGKEVLVEKHKDVNQKCFFFLSLGTNKTRWN